MEVKGMDKLPKDPIILLSYVNTQLRDFYHSLELFCQDKGVDIAALTETLGQADYVYDEKLNRFI